MNTTALRDYEVHAHVRSVAERIGCDDDGVLKAEQTAARALRAGKSSLKAIREASYVAAAHVSIQRRIAEQPSDEPMFTGELLVDCLGLIGLIAIAAVIVIAFCAFMGGPPE